MLVSITWHEGGQVPKHLIPHTDGIVLVLKTKRAMAAFAVLVHVHDPFKEACS